MKHSKYLHRVELVRDSITQSLTQTEMDGMLKVARALTRPWREGINSKPLIMTAGNGGSHAIAEHMCGELAWRLDKERELRLPCLCLTSNPTLLSALANDIKDPTEAISYYAGSLAWVPAESKEEEAIPWLIGFSTSGRSRNLRTLFSTTHLNYPGQWWRKIVFTGPDWSSEDGSCIPADWAFQTKGSTDTTIIQEVHMVMMHLFCQMIHDSLN